MSILTQISNFGNNAAAVEKTLRLAQSFAQIGSSLQINAADVAPYVMARGQFNICRRFLRLHKWIDNFNFASTAMYSSKPRIPKLLETGKFNFLGLYFLMELLTITDVMGFTKLEWGPWLVVESHRFWSYGLLCSILLAVWEWYFVGEDEEKRRLVVEKEKKKGTKGSLDKKVANSGPKKRRLPYKQIVIDGCDLFIPGAVVGWLPFSALTVAVAMAISTVLQLTDMWPKIQAQAAGASPQKK